VALTLFTGFDIFDNVVVHILRLESPTQLLIGHLPPSMSMFIVQFTEDHVSLFGFSNYSLVWMKLLASLVEMPISNQKGMGPVSQRSQARATAIQESR